MRLLEQFRPYLAGAVLKGTAGRYSDIDLQLFTDDGKAVELFLLNRNIAYDVSDHRHFAGDQARAHVERVRAAGRELTWDRMADGLVEAEGQVEDAGRGEIQGPGAARHGRSGRLLRPEPASRVQ